jgi:hypothetical protein
VLEATSEGELTPGEAATLLSAPVGMGRLTELDELERRTGNNDFLCLVRFDDETPEQALERELAEGNITERDRAYSYILVMSERDARL